MCEIRRALAKQAPQFVETVRGLDWRFIAPAGLSLVDEAPAAVDRHGHHFYTAYGWFTEGFDTTDLRQARALLEELA
jgi:hypothetical protein